MNGKGGKKRKATSTSVEDEIAAVNEILQSETTARESWQIGKRLKTLIDAHPDMTKMQLGNTMCMWGTAISRIASENDDATLAEAAMDKFQQALTLLGQQEMGPYGMALYGSTSMIVATEKQDRTVLEAALAQFEAAVSMDTPEAFESPFQYAKALKEGSVLVQHLLDTAATSTDNTAEVSSTPSFQSPAALQQKGLDICANILKHHASVLDGSSAHTQQTAEAEDAHDDDDEEEVEDEVTKEDLSEVILLQAQLTALLAASKPAADTSPDAIYDMFKQAFELHPENVNALIEMNSFVCRLGINPSGAAWVLPRLEWMQQQLDRVLHELDFDLDSCFEHVMRESKLDKPKEVNECVPKILDVLGRNLLRQLQACAVVANEHKTSAAAAALHAHALKVLQCAHHLHDTFGCYSLAKLHALPAFVNPTECHVWLETCESYGVLDDEFNAADFATMTNEPWYSAFAAPNGTLRPVVQADFLLAPSDSIQ
ncbi:hypothetical protein H310_10108 [Aphanomyces invadans]|uniref:Uncharacterized protein n=1 Tax=Aphanomyces invadans TaxID=157072 RepID=A0A024TT59_9STRA|nr:hypothetical protein H310_10108 [Aphanomyces invadans]ETV96816.1 hypothetical protein H310_10108 [Aphanomyces invadans]|eukprot:XP_008874593.1 hypothetical protein H310_10108 [Aphanomyces invadans]